MVVSDQYTAIAALPSLKCSVSKRDGGNNILPIPSIKIGALDIPDLAVETKLVAEAAATPRPSQPPQPSQSSQSSQPPIATSQDVSSTDKVPQEYIDESRILFDSQDDQQLYIQKLNNIVDMGFDVEAASRALLECRLEEGEAVERLLRD